MKRLRWSRMAPPRLIRARWELTWPDLWLGVFWQDRRGVRDIWITVPPFGLPCLPLHVSYPLPRPADPVPVWLIGPDPGRMTLAEWEPDSPQYRRAWLERSILLPTGPRDILALGWSHATPGTDAALLLEYGPDPAASDPHEPGPHEYTSWDDWLEAHP